MIRMTQTTKTVFEKHQIRKTKKQKTAFIEYVKTVSAEYGYSCTVEKGSFGVRNIVVGNIDSAKVVYGAHYDTCAVLPFPNFITPKSFLVYLFYQLLIVIPLLLGGFIVTVAASYLSTLSDVGFLIADLAPLVFYIAVLVLMVAGPANKHTANDNTSGVTTLLDIMTHLPEEYRDKAAFVFFDLEEAGLFGSTAFASKHSKTMKNKPLVNFDCVSDGKYIIFALNKKAKKYAPLLNECYPSDGRFTVEVLHKGVFYPSDQINFRLGIGVAALKKTKRLGILYMDRIHTPKDTVYEEDNVTFLVNGSVRLCEKI